MKKIIPWLTGINLIAVIILVNVLLSFYPFLRVDLSRNRIHSLSKATKDIISDLDDVINIKVYMSDDLPANVKPTADSLKTILEEFGRIKKSRLRVKYFDPLKDDDVRAEAERLGIMPLQFTTVKSDKFELSNGYLGLVLVYGDKEVVLPVAGDVGNLEYFLISGIKRLTSDGVKTVVIAEESLQPGASEITYFKEFLAQDYQVLDNKLGEEEELPEEAGALVVVGRRSQLTEAAMERLEKWVSDGKGLVAFLDKVAVDQSMVADKVETGGLGSFFEDRGMKMVDGLIWDESSTVATFRAQNDVFSIQYPYWLVVRPENVNRQIPAVSGIESLMMPWVAAIELSGEAVALFSSSERSVVDKDLTDLSPTANLRQAPGTDLGKKVLAAVNTEGMKLALVADSDFIKDQFVGGISQNNMILALNLVDYVSADESLLAIRSKTVSSSPIRPLEDRTKTVVKVINLVAPIVLLAAGGALSRWQRGKKNEEWN